MNNDTYIDLINKGIINIMRTAVEESRKLVDKEKIKLDPFLITSKNINSINNINNVLKTLENTIELLEENKVFDIAYNNNKEISLYDDFKNQKLEYIKIEGNIFYIDTYKDCVEKLCEYLTRDEYSKERFLNCINKLDKIFSNNKDELSSPRYISNINMYIETRRNANALARIMQRIIKEFGLSVDDVKIGIK